MKKVFLLCAVLGAGQLYGMEPEQKPERIGDLPQELQREITQKAISHSESSSYAITMIQKLSKVYGVQYGASLHNLKNFAQLVAILGSEFSTPPYTVAQEVVSNFGLPQQLFDEYLLAYKLAYKFTRAMDNNNIAQVTDLIKQGADVNFSLAGPMIYYKNNKPIASYNQYTPFDYAVIEGKAEIAQLLLDAGASAHPNSYYDEHGYSILHNPTDEDIKQDKLAREKIREIIDEAIAKQSSK